MKTNTLEFKDIFRVIDSYDPKTTTKEVSYAYMTLNYESKCDIEFNVEKELQSNQKTIESLEIRDNTDYTIRANLLLERVDLLKLKEVVDLIKSIK